MADWKITKPLGVCAGSEKDIEPGKEFFATLVETAAGLERRDYSVDFWAEHKPDVYCYWKSVMPLPDEKKKLFVDDDMLMAFFERLTEEQDPEKVNFRFVLTLILMRKRVLKYDSSRSEDGQEIWALKVTGQQRSVEAVNPHLTEDKIEELSGQLGQILQVEFDE